MSRTLAARLLFLLSFAVACSSGGVDLEEPRRVLGREADVRVDGQIFAERVGPGSAVRLIWEIENQSGDAIAVADLVPAVSYEAGERTLVVHIGSEVPGNDLVPRLIVIAPGEKKTFNGSAKANFHLPAPGPLAQYPRYMRMRVNFLSDIAPFQQLIEMSEMSVYDPDLADRLFPLWVEANQAIDTNSIPIQWTGVSQTPDITGRRF